jgi:DNA gyrase subunit A
VANGDDDPASLLTVCAHGYGKRTMLTEYRAQNRGGKGLIDIQTAERNGPVVAVTKVIDDDEVMLTTTGGMVIRTRVSSLRTIGRNTMGVRLIKLDDGDTVSSLAKLPEEELIDAAALEPTDLDAQGALSADEDAARPPSAEDGKQPRILRDGVAEAEASDHFDQSGPTDFASESDDEPEI